MQSGDQGAAQALLDGKADDGEYAALRQAGVDPELINTSRDTGAITAQEWLSSCQGLSWSECANAKGNEQIGSGLGWLGLGVYTKTAGEAESAVKGTKEVVAQYGPMNQGPLPKGIADTFRSDTYSEVVTKQPTILYRVYGGTAQKLGGYWTTTQPAGPVQSILDSALNPKWGNPATKVVEIEVPTGTKYFEGAAAPQGGLVGGGNQVVFPKNFNIDSSWVKNE